MTDFSYLDTKEQEKPSDSEFTWLADHEMVAPKQTAEQRPDWLVPAGAAAGAYGSYKGVGTGMFRPDPSVFAAKGAQATQIQQMAADALAKQEIQKALQPLTTPGMSDVEHTMQSGQGTRDGITGRQRESAHNWETNRQALAKEQNLQSAAAKRMIVESGPMAPTRGGIAVPQKVAYDLEQKRMLDEARMKVQQQAIEKATAEKAIQQRAAQEAAKQRAAQMAGLKSGAMKVGLGALGGGFAAKDAYDAYQSMKANGVNDQNIAQMVGGIGGGLMMVPTPITEGAGAAMIGGSMAWPHVREYFGYKPQ